MIVKCQTRTFQPQSVSWLRNGEFVIIDGYNYESIQVLRSRIDSEYEYSLIIRDVIGLIGSPTYTCIVSNSTLTVSQNTTIAIDISGIGNMMPYHYCYIYKHFIYYFCNNMNTDY